MLSRIAPVGKALLRNIGEKVFSRLMVWQYAQASIELQGLVVNAD